MADSCPESGDCFGRRVPAPAAGCTQLRWDPVSPYSGRVRVRDYTCDCQPTFYELCEAGGLLHIRRSRRKGGTTLIDESAFNRRAKAMEVWALLLSGLVR